MRNAAITLGLALALGTPVLAQEGVVDARAAQMSANGAPPAAAGAMLKGQLDYAPPVGKAAIASFESTALSFGLMFPDGATSKEASPKIWEDRAGFDAELAKFQKAAAAAVEASGKSGPADLAAFQGVVQPVLDTCKSCHEKYRLDD